MQIKSSGNLGILYLSGIIHRESADTVTKMFEILNKSDVKTIIISFNNVKALLSDGIRLLVSLADEARYEKKEFFITDLPKEVKYTLKITNLLQLLGYAGSSVNLLKEKNVNESSLKSIDSISENSTKSAKNSQIEDIAKASEQASTTKQAQPTTENSINKLKSIGNITSKSSATSKNKARQLSTHKAHRLTPKELKLAIRNHVPGRLELQIVIMLLKSNKSVLGIKDFSKELKTKDSLIKKAVKHLLNCGTITSMGAGLYNYAPSEEVKNKINTIIRLLQQRTTHSQTLKLLLNCEK